MFCSVGRTTSDFNTERFHDWVSRAPANDGHQTIWHGFCARMLFKFYELLLSNYESSDIV